MTNKTKQIGKPKSTLSDTEVVETITDEEGEILATAETRPRFDCVPYMLFFVRTNEGEQRELIGGYDAGDRDSLEMLKEAYNDYTEGKPVITSL